MILIYKCRNCSESFTLPFKANDRGELNRKSNLIGVCSSCNYKNELTINKIKAIISPYNNFAYGFALLLNIIIGFLIYYYFDFKLESTNSPWQYYVLSLIFLAPFLFAKVSIENDLKAVQTFNRYYV